MRSESAESANDIISIIAHMRTRVPRERPPLFRCFLYLYRRDRRVCAERSRDRAAQCCSRSKASIDLESDSDHYLSLSIQLLLPARSSRVIDNVISDFDDPWKDFDSKEEISTMTGANKRACPSPYPSLPPPLSLSFSLRWLLRAEM